MTRPRRTSSRRAAAATTRRSKRASDRLRFAPVFSQPAARFRSTEAWPAARILDRRVDLLAGGGEEAQALAGGQDAVELVGPREHGGQVDSLLLQSVQPAALAGAEQDDLGTKNDRRGRHVEFRVEGARLGHVGKLAGAEDRERRAEGRVLDRRARQHAGAQGPRLPVEGIEQPVDLAGAAAAQLEAAVPGPHHTPALARVVDQEEGRLAPARPDRQPCAARPKFRRRRFERVVDFAPALDQAAERRRRRGLQRRQLGVDEQRATLAEETRHEPREGFREAALGRQVVPAVVQAPAVLVVRRRVPDPGQQRRRRRAEMAAADRHERRRILAQGERLGTGGREVAPRHFGIVVVFGRHPEQRHGGTAPARQFLGPQHAGRGLGQGEQRPRSQPALLAGDDDQGRRVGERVGEGRGARVAVALVGLGQSGRERSAIRRGTARRRRHPVLGAGQHESQGIEQVEVAAVEEAPRQIAEQPAGAEVGTARGGGVRGAIRHGGTSYRRAGVESAA